MIKSMAHICITATDLEATERFYCAGLGFERAFRFVRQGKTAGLYLKAPGGFFVEVFCRDGAQALGVAAISHFCLEAEDLAPLREHLQALGYAVTEPKMGADQSWQMWVTDPGGVRIEFHQYTENSSQRTGQDCILG